MVKFFFGVIFILWKGYRNFQKCFLILVLSLSYVVLITSVLSFLNQIINWRTCLKFPDEPKISDEAKDLICHLLCNVETRLGTRGVEEIKVYLHLLEMFIHEL